MLMRRTCRIQLIVFSLLPKINVMVRLSRLWQKSHRNGIFIAICRVNDILSFRDVRILNLRVGGEFEEKPERDFMVFWNDK